MKTFNVTVSIPINAQDVDDILGTALDGGITYWCDEAKVSGEWPKGAEFASEALTRGANLELHSREPEEGTDGYFILTMDMFIKGFTSYVAKCGWSGYIDDIDASMADEIVQYALFGKVVFG